jgi:transposase
MNRTLTRRIAFVEQYDRLVGIDLGKKQNVAVVIDQHNRLHGRLCFGHRRDSYEQLLAWLQQQVADRPGAAILVGMEPTNDYWQWLARYLSQAGIGYRLVNCFSVKKSREGMQLDYAKDDQRDAMTIARLLREGQFTETQLLSGVYARLRHYEQAHWRLRRALGREKTILRQEVERLFPEMAQVFGDYTGQTATALLRHHAQPAQIAALSWQTFVAGVRADFTGTRLMVKKIQQVYELALLSIGLGEDSALQQLICQRLDTIAHQQQQLAELEQALVDSLTALPEAPFLLSVGLGEVTTALLAAELGELRRFRSAKQLVKLAGIQPTPHQSGQRQRSQTPMSGKGRSRLRTYLFFATLRLIRTDPAFQAQFRRLRQRPTHPLKRAEAVGVLMNKLLHLLWAVQHHQTSYQRARLLAATTHE